MSPAVPPLRLSCDASLTALTAQSQAIRPDLLQFDQKNDPFQHPYRETCSDPGVDDDGGGWCPRVLAMFMLQFDQNDPLYISKSFERENEFL